MSDLHATFADYQKKYEYSILPPAVQETLSQAKGRFHRVVITVDEWNQGPDLILKAAQLGTSLLSFIPPIEPILETPKQFCRDVKIFTGLLKGFKSIDNLFNFTYAWKVLVLQTSSMTLFAVNILSLGERFNLFEVAPIRVALAAIPIIGILPYRGIISSFPREPFRHDAFILL